MTQTNNLPHQVPQKQQIINQTQKKVIENHLSSSTQLILKYEIINFQIEDATKNTKLSKQLISESMKEPLEASTKNREQIARRYGTIIENQSMFLRQMIYDNYVPYLPNNFKRDFSEIMVLGAGFEAFWWGTLVLVLFKGYKNRHINIPFRQKARRGVGMFSLFILTSLGFHSEVYIPKLKTCFYKNLESLDPLMDRHLKILQASGSTIRQKIAFIESQKKPTQNIEKIVPSNDDSKKDSVSKE